MDRRSRLDTSFRRATALIMLSPPRTTSLLRISKKWTRMWSWTVPRVLDPVLTVRFCRYKNFRCQNHNRFFEVNLYQKNPTNAHHWRANLARPSRDIDLAFRRKDPEAESSNKVEESVGQEEKQDLLPSEIQGKTSFPELRIPLSQVLQVRDNTDSGRSFWAGLGSGRSSAREEPICEAARHHDFEKSPSILTSHSRNKPWYEPPTNPAISWMGQYGVGPWPWVPKSLEGRINQLKYRSISLRMSYIIYEYVPRCPSRSRRGWKLSNPRNTPRRVAQWTGTEGAS